MPYHLLADTVLVLHFLFILFVIFGAGLIFVNPKWAWAQVPAALWGAIIEYQGWICPLTPLENHLRQRAGQSGYPGGFIEHLLTPIIYPDFLTETIQLFFAVGVIVINISVYLWYYFKCRPDRHQ